MASLLLCHQMQILQPASTRTDGKTDIRSMSDKVLIEKANRNTLDIYQSVMWSVESRYGPVIEVFEVEGT